MFAGSFLIVLSLIIASFANNVQGLLATQGVVYAIGGILIYFPSIQYIEEWFVAKRGLAYGVMWAGTGKFPQFHLHQNADDFHSTEGSAGVVVPFILQWLLNSYGFRTALRAWAIVLVSESIQWRLVSSADKNQGNRAYTMPPLRQRPPSSNYGKRSTSY